MKFQNLADAQIYLDCWCTASFFKDETIFHVFAKAKDVSVVLKQESKSSPLIAATAEELKLFNNADLYSTCEQLLEQFDISGFRVHARTALSRPNTGGNQGWTDYPRNNNSGSVPKTTARDVVPAIIKSFLDLMSDDWAILNAHSVMFGQPSCELRDTDYYFAYCEGFLYAFDKVKAETQQTVHAPYSGSFKIMGIRFKGLPHYYK